MILVTGGSGVLGSRLVKGLVKQGRPVRVLTLPADRFVTRISGYGVDICYGDISKRETIKKIFDGVDTVYHLAAIILSEDDKLYNKINVEGTFNMIAEAAVNGVKHFIYVSSASVVYQKPTAYSLSKKEAEKIVVGSGLNYTIVRPTLIYERNGGEEFLLFLDYLRKFPVVPFIGRGNALKRPVYVDDILHGLLLLCENNVAYKKTYNFSGAETISILNFAKLCLKVMGMEHKPIIHLPIWMCMAIAAIMKLLTPNPPLRWPVIAGIIQDANLDPSEAISDLGYKPSEVSKKLPECLS